MIIPALTKNYDGRTVLTLPEIELKEGKIYAIIGANGCGKSTFAKILARVHESDEGWTTPKNIHVGYMPQKSYPFRMSVVRNLTLNGGSRQEAERMLSEFGLSDLAKHNAANLSGGETARMAMARLLMHDYQLLVLDEPTASMDITAALEAERILLEYQKRTNAGVVLVTHSLKQAQRIADEVLFFKDGKLIENGAAKQVLDAPENEETKQFLEYYSL